MQAFLPHVIIHIMHINDSYLGIVRIDTFIYVRAESTEI